MITSTRSALWLSSLCLLLSMRILAGAEEIAAGPKPFPRKNMLGRQGLTITTNSSEVEIFVNGKSYGKHDALMVELPVGRYRIVGRRQGYFDDIEYEKVERLSIDNVSLTLKKLRIQISPRFGALIMRGRKWMPCFSLNAGLRLPKHYIGVFLVESPGVSGVLFAGGEQLSGRGLSYHYIVTETEHFIVAPGAALVQWDHKKYGNYYGYEPLDRFLSVGPKMSFQVGFDHWKLVAAVNYLVRADKDWKLMGERNIAVMELGGAVAF